MTIKETILPLADEMEQKGVDVEAAVLTNAPLKETLEAHAKARAALCDALDAADRDKFQSEYIIAEAAGDVDRLEAENAALRLDAERYQWLTADHPDYETRMWLQAIADSLWCRGKGSSDAAIDATRAALDKP
jgi:hypothetical protein